MLLPNPASLAGQCRDRGTLLLRCECQLMLLLAVMLVVLVTVLRIVRDRNECHLLRKAALLQQALPPRVK